MQMASLTATQIESFRRDGYLLLENVIADGTLEKLSSEFEQ